MVFLINDLKGIRQVYAPSMYATIAPVLAAEAVRTYEVGGPDAFAVFSQRDFHQNRRIFLLDGFYKDVLGGSLTDDGLRVAHATRNGQLFMLGRNIAAYKLVSASGRPYILLIYLTKSLWIELIDALVGRNLPYTIGLFLLVTALCFVLAYHIAAPIHSIQSTARRVAQGDLKARVPSNVAKRFDELSALAKDFDSMVDRLELLIETQRSLLNSVSHELRSPLARINLAVAMLKERYAADADDMLQHLDRDVERIDVLIGQLLILSRLESGLSSSEREEVDLAQLVEGTVADCHFEAEASGKSVSLHTAGAFLLRSADPHALRSACENVIRNAVRFSQPGTNVEVLLAIDRNGSEPQVTLSVRDYGPGVPEEALDAIFQPFYRIAGDGQEPDGNGLGLAIAAEAIRLHRGTISASNCRPIGLEITIRLPGDLDMDIA
ncbi:signal transduction histidine kinase [Granulicella aggregans]|uniref:histidine kinase n=1 Tax=Granulicella aggregans TaxID=474949 RepID=A0A7W7ZJG6_9BACT|nr:ATP-binding protein [Granulicella aggregans]MBB5060868.1 signal transduction histidine kinase [Granulicella aggregans]